MKTKDEVLDTIAIKYGYRNWVEVSVTCMPETIYNLTLEAMEYYAEQSNSHKHGVVRGGDLKRYPVQAAASQNTYTVINTTGAAPPVLLPAEGQGEANTGFYCIDKYAPKCEVQCKFCKECESGGHTRNCPTA